MTTMHAWLRDQRGPARTALQLSTNHPRPTPPSPASADILIRVSHVAVQFSSEILFNLLPRLPFTSPPIPELEFTGTVVAAASTASSDVRDVGTRVAAYQDLPGVFVFGRGVLAEYVRIPSSQAARLPPDADVAAMAGVNGSGSTALKMMRVGGVRAGHRVLVNGASGSVGSLLVQICKLRGVSVVGVASGGNEEMVRGLGVDEFIDYRKLDSLPAHLASTYADNPFDFILDCVGLQALYTHSPAYLKPNGKVINIGSMEGAAVGVKNWFLNVWRPRWLGGTPRQYVMFSTPPSKDDLLVLLRMVEEGQLKVSVDSVFKMEDAIEAYERVGTMRARGRVIVKVQRD